jgi:hypothetical protein
MKCVADDGLIYQKPNAGEIESIGTVSGIYKYCYSKAPYKYFGGEGGIRTPVRLLT